MYADDSRRAVAIVDVDAACGGLAVGGWYVEVSAEAVQGLAVSGRAQLFRVADRVVRHEQEYLVLMSLMTVQGGVVGHDLERLVLSGEAHVSLAAHTVVVPAVGRVDHDPRELGICDGGHVRVVRPFDDVRSAGLKRRYLVAECQAQRRASDDGRCQLAHCRTVEGAAADCHVKRQTDGVPGTVLVEGVPRQGDVHHLSVVTADDVGVLVGHRRVIVAQHQLLQVGREGPLFRPFRGAVAVLAAPEAPDLEVVLGVGLQSFDAHGRCRDARHRLPVVGTWEGFRDDDVVDEQVVLVIRCVFDADIPGAGGNGLAEECPRVVLDALLLTEGEGVCCVRRRAVAYGE